MRDENCVDARVRVIRRIANTIDTTVIIEVATLLRIICATPGSSCEGKRVCGIQALIAGTDSSNDESTAPMAPKTTAMANGRIRKPPRSEYTAERNTTGRRSNIPDPRVSSNGTKHKLNPSRSGARLIVTRKRAPPCLHRKTLTILLLDEHQQPQPFEIATK